MSKRFPRSEMRKPVDLDKVLRCRRYQRRVEGASDSIATDPDNLMDNWYMSAMEARRQRDSKDYRERASWEARKVLNPGQYELTGSWRYYRNRDEKSWRQTGLTRRARDAFGTTIKFHAWREDIELSDVYRLWLEGRKMEFLNAVYSYYGDNNIIPEEVIWRLFRCIISEIIPKEDQWDDAPKYLIEQPNTIWQAAKCIFQTITRGRFWSEDYNALNPIDNNEKFGDYKKKVLQKIYSKNLMKYVLACISTDPTKRYFRNDLLDHFNFVLSVFEGTFQPPEQDESLWTPYIPTNQLIPYDLTREEGSVYESLLEVVEERKKLAGDNKQRIPHIVIVTDLAKDYDDLLAMMCLKELHRLGLVHIEGFVANLMPSETRALFGRGALNSLGYPDIKVAVGTIGDSKRVLDPHTHEFDNTDDFMPPKETIASLPDGQELMKEIFTRAVEHKFGITILAISSLMDLARFAEDHGDLLKNGLSNVVLQGGYRIIKGKLTADFAAQNNKFDEDGATAFHDFMQENNIPSTAWNKVAAQAVPIYNTLFEYLDQTGHPLGPYLRKVQVKQDLNFYERACSDHPYAPYMTQDWYVGTKSTWFAAGHEPDEPYPIGEDMIPYFTKVVAYDALAAVGSAGEDVLDKFGIVKPIVRRKDVDDKIHRLVGIPAVKETEDHAGLPQEENFDADKMGLVITALLKGSILAKQQGL